MEWQKQICALRSPLVFTERLTENAGDPLKATELEAEPRLQLFENSHALAPLQGPFLLHEAIFLCIYKMIKCHI